MCVSRKEFVNFISAKKWSSSCIRRSWPTEPWALSVQTLENRHVYTYIYVIIVHFFIQAGNFIFLYSTCITFQMWIIHKIYVSIWLISWMIMLFFLSYFSRPLIMFYLFEFAAASSMHFYICALKQRRRSVRDFKSLSFYLLNCC